MIYSVSVSYTHLDVYKRQVFYRSNLTSVIIYDICIGLCDVETVGYERHQNYLCYGLSLYSLISLLQHLDDLHSSYEWNVTIHRNVFIPLRERKYRSDSAANIGVVTIIFNNLTVSLKIMFKLLLDTHESMFRPPTIFLKRFYWIDDILHLKPIL